MALTYLYSFILALSLSLLMMPVLIRMSASWGLVDDPSGNARKLHTEVIPRSGGIGIIFASGLAILLVLPITGPVVSFLLASLAIIAFGLLDDFVELSPLQKLLGQSLGVVIAMAGGMSFTSLPFFPDGPAWFYDLVTFMFVLGVINGVNFSDGMDGLAAGITLMALILILILAIESGNTSVAVVCLAVSASLLGFLRFNTHPARIFMGDSGSQFLGFSLAWLSITVSNGETQPFTTLMPLLVLGIPVMDILQVVPVRIHKGLPLPGPDKEHFHHQVAKLGFRQEEVVAIIYILQAILLEAAYFLRGASHDMVLGFYAVYLGSVLGTIYLANVFGWKIRSIDDISGYRKRNPFFRKLGEYHPYTGKFFGILMTVFLVFAALNSADLSENTIYGAIFLAVVLIISLLVTDTRWTLGLGRLAAYPAVVLVSWGIAQSVESSELNLMIDFAIGALAVLLILAVRITRKYYFDLTNVDLLVLIFFVTLTPLLSIELGTVSSVIRLVFRICVLLYVSEYVLARGEKARRRLTYSSVLALFALAIHL